MRLRRDLFWPALAGVTLLALILRLAYLAELQGSPLLSGLMGDSRQYDAWAQRIAGGEWVGTEVFYQAPLYPYWLAVIFAITGHDLSLVRLIQAALGAASCFLLGLAGRRYFSERAGVVAALLLAVYPPALFFDGLIQKSSLDIFLVTLILVLLGEFEARRDGRWLAAAGLTAAAFMLNRENARVLALVIGAWLWFGFGDVPARRRAGWVAIFAAAILIVLLPVGYRNHRVGGDFLVSTSQFGPNFYIGNNAAATGTYEPLVAERGDALYERDDAVRIASAAAGRTLSPGEVSDYWLGQAFAYIRTRPLQWLGLLGKKALLTVNAAELPDTESIQAYAGESRILRGLLWLDFGVLLPLAALGGWTVRAGWRRHLILYGIFGGLALAVAAFYVVARYRHPLAPIVLLFAGAGLAGVLEMHRREPAPAARAATRGRARKAAAREQTAASRVWTWQWLPGLAIAGVVAVIAHLPVITVRDQTYLNLGSLLAQNGRPADAIPMLSKAVSLDPGHAEARFRLGLAFRDSGDSKAAIDELTAAVRLRPDHADAHAALAVLLDGQNRTAEALLHFQAAAALAPSDPGAHANLAMALARSRDLESALTHFGEAIRLQPDNYAVRLAFGETLCDAGRIADGIEQFDAAARLSPDAIDPLTLAAQAQAGAGRLTEAVASLQKALAVATTTGRTEAARGISDSINKLNAAIERRSR